MEVIFHNKNNTNNNIATVDNWIFEINNIAVLLFYFS